MLKYYPGHLFTQCAWVEAYAALVQIYSNDVVCDAGFQSTNVITDKVTLTKRFSLAESGGFLFVRLDHVYPNFEPKATCFHHSAPDKRGYIYIKKVVL